MLLIAYLPRLSRATCSGQTLARILPDVYFSRLARLYDSLRLAQHDPLATPDSETVGLFLARLLPKYFRKCCPFCSRLSIQD